MKMNRLLLAFLLGVMSAASVCWAESADTSINSASTSELPAAAFRKANEINRGSIGSVCVTEDHNIISSQDTSHREEFRACLAAFLRSYNEDLRREHAMSSGVKDQQSAQSDTTVDGAKRESKKDPSQNPYDQFNAEFDRKYGGCRRDKGTIGRSGGKGTIGNKPDKGSIGRSDEDPCAGQ